MSYKCSTKYLLTKNCDFPSLVTTCPPTNDHILKLFKNTIKYYRLKPYSHYTLYYINIRNERIWNRHQTHNFETRTEPANIFLKTGISTGNIKRLVYCIWKIKYIINIIIIIYLYFNTLCVSALSMTSLRLILLNNFFNTV